MEADAAGVAAITDILRRVESEAVQTATRAQNMAWTEMDAQAAALTEIFSDTQRRLTRWGHVVTSRTHGHVYSR